MKTWKSMVGVIVGVMLARAAPATAKEIFVGSSPGDSNTLANAVLGAVAGDTIIVRGGYSTAGAAITKPNLTIRAENNWDKPGFDPADMTAINPARGAESTITNSVSLRYISASTNASGARILGIFFNIPATAPVGAAIACPDFATGMPSNIVVRNCRFKNLNTSANTHFGTGGSISPCAHNVLIEGNRFGSLALASASLIIGGGMNWTVKSNYFNINADGGRASENGRRGWNMLMSTNIVFAYNYFKDHGGVAGNSWALQPNGRCSNIIAANNKFNGCARDFNWWPAGANFLIAGNESRNIQISPTGGGGGYSLDMLPGGNAYAAGQNAMNNMVVRQNFADIVVNGDLGAFRWALIRPWSTSVEPGSILIERNEVTISGTAGANTSARGGIRFGSGDGQDRFDLLGPITIRDNVMDATGYDDGAGDVPAIAFFFPATPGARPGGMNLSASNNVVKGFTCGAYVDTAYTGKSPGMLPVGDSVLLLNNNFLTNLLVGVQGGTNGAGINIAGSYFSGNGMDTSNNVTGTPGGSANAVAAYDPNYVVFRGDFNLDNAVNDADRLVWSNGFGTAGTAATYFRGDASLDQMVSAADLLVWRRYNGLDINASAPAPAPAATPGAPVVRYYAGEGRLTIAGASSTAWAFEFPNGASNLSVSANTAGNLGASWRYAAFTNWPATNRFEFVDATAGGGTAPVQETEVATLPLFLTVQSFGPVTYYVGGNTFQTAVTVVQPPQGAVYKLM